jgi:hypothetical protein
MKSKFFAIAIFFLAFTTLSSFAPSSTPSNTSISAPSATNAHTSEITPEKSSDVTNPKVDKKAKRMQKILNSKAGKWLIAKMQKRIEKRHAKLSNRLAIAEKAGDTKKVDKIKKEMNAKGGNLKRLSIALIVIGLICLLVGILVNSGPIYGLGGLLLLIGLIILLLAYFDVI